MQESCNQQVRVPVGLVVPMWGRSEKQGDTFEQDGVKYYVLGDGDKIKSGTELYRLASKYFSKPRYPDSVKGLNVKGGPSIVKIGGKMSDIDADDYWAVMRGVYGTSV